MSKSNRGGKSETGRLAKPLRPSEPSKNAERTPTGSGPEGEENSGAAIPPVLPIVNSSDTNPRTNQEHDCSPREPEPKRDWMTFFTGLLVIVGFITCFVMIWQNVLTGQAIVVANNANNISQDAFESTQRARIGHIDITVPPEIDKGEVAKAVIGFRNFGRDPAKMVRHDAQFQTNTVFADGSIPTLGSVAKETCQKVDKIQGGVIVYPSETIPYNFIFNRQIVGEISGIKSGLEILSFEGCTVYQTMGEKKQSWFCFYWQSEADKPISTWTWRYCPNGNDGD